ncbi:MAG: membrane lipoprotein lipid attachment site-containing protein [Fibrobacteraceae bacterium]|nr:membrane lipoprotein lipid attachment site-containing protein [Fibrobacteraceae bacterium]
MKKIIFAALSALTLTACSSYERHQTPDRVNAPMDCAMLHMRGAQWNYVDQYGNNVTAQGVCNKGRKHGNFAIYVDGAMVAKVKFSKDAEQKTACLVGGQHRSTFAKCMEEVAQSRKGGNP